MNRKNPLITIAIPTYNRSKYLNELLTSLENQLKNNPEIQIIISDNASTDATSDVVTRFIDRGLAAEYIRNPHNIGAEANFVQCFNLARGKYFWIIGDDDIIVPNGIKAILNVLNQKDFDLVYIESFAINKKDRVLNTYGDILLDEMNNPREFAKKIHVYFTFISGNIINRDKVARSMTIDPHTLIGSSLVQLSWIYTALNEFSCGLRIRSRLVGARMDNTGGYKLFNVFGKNLKEITTKYVKDEKAARYIINGTIQRYLPGLIISYERNREKFVNEGDIIKLLHTEFSKNLLYWFYIYPILHLPKRVAKLFHIFIRIINKIDRVFGLLIAGLRWDISRE